VIFLNGGRHGPDGLTNIFSYAEMAERYKITTDSEGENAFIVHLPDKKVKFEKNENNLYVYTPKKVKKEKRYDKNLFQ
jgi:hypothetical protein